MKSLLTILSLAIIIQFSACKKDDTEATTGLTGKWTMIGNYISAGGPQYYVPVNDFSSYVIFNTDGSLLTPAKVTVFFNGILVQNDVALSGPTLYIGKPVYKPHGPAPIKLQAHGDKSEPISYRNIWVREL